jgi:hypothetical protein
VHAFVAMTGSCPKRPHAGFRQTVGIGAQQFIDWLISPECQDAIHKINGQRLFYPNANDPNACRSYSHYRFRSHQTCPFSYLSRSPILSTLGPRINLWCASK